MKKMLSIIFFTIIFTASFCFAQGYHQHSTTHKNNTNHTYIDKNSGKTYGGTSTTYGNTTYHNNPSWSGQSTRLGNTTNHTYFDKKTGATTGGFTRHHGNSSTHHGSPKPHPYNGK